MTYLTNNDYIKSYTEKEILLVSFKNKIFEFFEDSKAIENLIDLLKRANLDRDIKFILFTSEPDVLAYNNYKIFFEDILKNNSSGEKIGFPEYSNKKSRYKEIIHLDQLIQFMIGYSKICVACFAGNVVTPFLGLLLACDLRYGAENTSFSLAHNEYGLHPSGALPFFLIQEVGYSRAVEIMLSASFSVFEAHNLGLVNKVFHVDGFLENCIKEIHKYSHIEYSTIINTKRLSAISRDDIDDYIQCEKSLLNLGI